MLLFGKWLRVSVSFLRNSPSKRRPTYQPVQDYLRLLGAGQTTQRKAMKSILPTVSRLLALKASRAWINIFSIPIAAEAVTLHLMLALGRPIRSALRRSIARKEW
jgi:hypothetical protein